MTNKAQETLERDSVAVFFDTKSLASAMERLWQTAINVKQLGLLSKSDAERLQEQLDAGHILWHLPFPMPTLTY